MNKKIAIVAGTRPEFIKLVPVIKALRTLHGEDNVVVYSTGQHRTLMDQAIAAMQVKIDHDFDLMQHGQSPSDIQHQIVKACSAHWKDHRPALVMVQGDTVSALSGAIAAHLNQIPVVHVEAGLRTYDLHNPWPEEGIRQMIARIADLHLAPTPTARKNLINEKIKANRIHVVGNPGIDSFVSMQSHTEQDMSLPTDFSIDVPFTLITMHRREALNGALDQFCECLKDVIGQYPYMRFLWTLHPNPAVRETIQRHFQINALTPICFCDPLPYLQMTKLLPKASLVISDSGGMQEEAPWCGVPVAVARDLTERTEIIELGLGKIVGANGQGLLQAMAALTATKPDAAAIKRWQDLQGNGRAARTIAQHVTDFLQQS